jgi:site-specific DNA-methyltransferase (adenine-specific)
LSDGGAQASAIPLYHKFVQQAKKINPKYLIMIIPSRWFTGGRGLDDFREEMLHDTRLQKIVDYFDSTECFPGVDISGGICYFLWERDNRGYYCEIVSIHSGQKTIMERPLLEQNNDTFIRFNEAVSIVRKVSKLKEKKFDEIVSSQKPFGLRTYVLGSPEMESNSIQLYANRNICKEIGYISRTEITENKQWIDLWKVYISAAYGERGSFPYLVLGKPFLGEPNSCCTETFQVIGPFETEIYSQNVIKYISTRFFRFLVLLIKNTQHAPKRVYSLVPIQDFNEEWTDEKLYKKYDLSPDEINFIESMIRPMSDSGADVIEEIEEEESDE